MWRVGTRTEVVLLWRAVGPKPKAAAQTKGPKASTAAPAGGLRGESAHAWGGGHVELANEHAPYLAGLDIT